MRVGVLLTLFATACASAGTASSDGTRTSVAYTGSRGAVNSPVIRIQAGTVRLRHSVPSTGRLRSTTLEGLDDANRGVRYEWERDGTYQVAVSGRYRHSVSGAIVGDGMDRLESTLTYTELPDGSGP